jgi:hypothetical protein
LEELSKWLTTGVKARGYFKLYEMELSRALEILRQQQSWRLGKTDEMKCTPRELTEAIDTLLLQFDENGEEHF